MYVRTHFVGRRLPKFRVGLLGLWGDPLCPKSLWGRFLLLRLPAIYKNDLIVTWDTMGPIAQPKVGPGRESRFGRRIAKCWKCGTRRPKPAASDTGGALTIISSFQHKKT